MRSLDFFRLLLVFGGTLGLLVLRGFAAERIRLPDWTFFVVLLLLPYLGYCTAILRMPRVQKIGFWLKHLVAHFVSLVLTAFAFVIVAVWIWVVGVDN